MKGKIKENARLQKYVPIRKAIRNLENQSEEEYVSKILIEGVMSGEIPGKYILGKKKSKRVLLNKPYVGEIIEYLEGKGVNIGKLDVRESLRRTAEAVRKLDIKEMKINQDRIKSKVRSYNLADCHAQISLEERRELIKDLEAKVNLNPAQRYGPRHIVHGLKIPLKFMQDQISTLGEYNLSLGGYLGRGVLELAQKFREMQNLPSTTCNIYKPQ